MKKLLLVFSSFFILTFSAQQASAQQPRFGAKGGLNLSNLYTSDIDENNMRAGFHLGLFAKTPVSDAFAIQPELIYSTQGARFKDDGFVEDLSINLDYINLPVLAVVDISDFFSVHAGPYIGFLLNDPYGSFDTDLIGGDYDFDRDNFNAIDFGLAGGISVNFQAVSLGVRYNHGLNPVGDEGFAGELFDESKNSNWQLYLAVGGR